MHTLGDRYDDADSERTYDRGVVSLLHILLTMREVEDHQEAMRKDSIEPAFIDSKLPHDPYVERPAHRLTTVRSTSLSVPISHLSAPLYLGRLTPYYSARAVAVPTRLRTRSVDVTSCRGQRSLELDDRLQKLSINLFQTRSGRVLYAVTLDVTLAASDLVSFLEDCYYESLQIKLPTGLELTLGELVDGEIKEIFSDAQWTAEPDLHQILFLASESLASTSARQVVEIDHDFLRSLVYRVATAQRDGFTSIQFPSELNRNMNTVAAVGSFVSVFTGHQDYIENCAVLSAGSIIAATTEMRTIQESLLTSYSLMKHEIDTLGRLERRQLLGEISARLAMHEMELSEHVELAADIGLWVPSLRVEDYHRTLAESVRLTDRANTIGRSIQRLTSIATAKAQVFQAEEQELQDHRRRSWALIAGLLTTIAIPTGIILAFFGITAPQVDPRASIFDLRRYMGVYLFAFGMIGTSMLLVFLFWFFAHPIRRHRR